MSTIIRVKRRLQDNPVDAVMVTYKKRKTEVEEAINSVKAGECSTNDDLPVCTVLNFTGTVHQKDDAEVTKLVRHKSINIKHCHKPEIRDRKRTEMKKQHAESRFRLLNLARSMDNTIVDVDIDGECVIDSDTEDAFVYDIYSSNIFECEDLNDAYIDNLLSVQPIGLEMQYRGSEDDEDFGDPYEDDSNDENNWRNEYPDSDNSENEELAKNFSACNLDSYDLSSDTEDEHYLQDCGLAPLRSYAKYKKQVLQELEDSDEEISDSFVDCYTDNEDDLG